MVVGWSQKSTSNAPSPSYAHDHFDSTWHKVSISKRNQMQNHILSHDLANSWNDFERAIQNKLTLWTSYIIHTHKPYCSVKKSNSTILSLKRYIPTYPTISSTTNSSPQTITKPPLIQHPDELTTTSEQHFDYLTTNILHKPSSPSSHFLIPQSAASKGSRYNMTILYAVKPQDTRMTSPCDGRSTTVSGLDGGCSRFWQIFYKWITFFFGDLMG